MDNEKFHEVAERISNIVNSMFHCEIAFKGYKGCWWGEDNTLRMTSGPSLNWSWVITEEYTEELYKKIDTPSFYDDIFPIVESVLWFTYKDHAGQIIAREKTRELYDDIDNKRKEMTKQFASEVLSLDPEPEPLNEELDILE